MKIGLTSEAFRAYVPQITEEVNNFIKKYPAFKGSKGTVNIDKATAEITIYTASRTLQGKEVRDRFDSSFADLYHDLDMGFSPINFMLHWAPLPHNRARDHAQRTIAKTYMDIINERRAKGYDREAKDIMLQLMHSSYKNGKKVPDVEIAHMMIALLMAGQHSSASSSCWIMLRLASRPDVMEAICEEQLRVLNGKDLEYEDLAKMPLIKAVINETLRLHTPIHSIMRAVKSPMPIPGTNFIIPTDHVLLSSPGVTSQSDQYFPQSEKWDPYRWIDRNSAGTAMAEEEFEDYGFGMISKGAKSPFLPFGAGRHRCIGEQFGMVQLSTITIAIVREFKFRNVSGKEGVVDTDYSSLFSKPLAPCVIEWERRTKA